MATRTSSTAHLSKVPLFSECTAKELSLVARNSTERTVSAGSVIVDQGQTGREAFVILEGSATVRRNARKVAVLGDGDVFGELSLLDYGPRTATVVADTDMRLLVVSERGLGSAIRSVPAINRRLLKALASRVRELDRAQFG